MPSVLYVNFFRIDLKTKTLLYYHKNRRKGETINVKYQYQYTMTLSPVNEGYAFRLSESFIFLILF